MFQLLYALSQDGFFFSHCRTGHTDTFFPCPNLLEITDQGQNWQTDWGGWEGSWGVEESFYNAQLIQFDHGVWD